VIFNSKAIKSYLNIIKNEYRNSKEETAENRKRINGRGVDQIN